MIICIDLDGVICEIRKPHQTYDQVKPLPGAIKKIQRLKKAGHYIIISTARHMETTGGNVNQIMSKVGFITLNWLKNYNIPYDEINFGKPYAHLYIDDKAYRFTKWKLISNDGKNLPVLEEDQDK